MKKDIPRIDDLTMGINDSDVILSEVSQNTESLVMTPRLRNDESCWNMFLSIMEPSDKHYDKSERLVCKLDRDLADSLDDCNINNRSRSDLVNAIVRSFFGIYLPKLAQYRRENKSLFCNQKEELQ